jgi:predicted ribosome quality control (RQC) complex YloA/Tae2 family protein
MSEYYERRIGPDPYAAAKQRVALLIERAQERLLRKNQSLQRSTPADGTIAELRRKGELLFTFSHAIAPRQTAVILGVEGEAPLSIELNPRLTVVENAQEYFRRYEKARAAAAEVPALIAAVDEELAFLHQLENDLDLALDHPGIAAVEAALAEAGYVPKPPRSKPIPLAPLQVTSADGFTIWVGRNSWQNEEVTFKMGSARDLWLHADGVPGAHVIVRTEGSEVPESTLVQAAQLAASHSAARGISSVRVAYTLRQNVRRARSGRPGQVYLTGHKTLVVRTGP